MFAFEGNYKYLTGAIIVSVICIIIIVILTEVIDFDNATKGFLIFLSIIGGGVILFSSGILIKDYQATKTKKD